MIQRDESLLAALAQEQGKLVVSLCVDPSGKVVFVECDQQKSTIKNPALQKKAEMLAESYVWDKAAEQECGRLSFIFKLD